MSTEQNNAGPVAFGCHCDLEPGMEPDGCVIDKGMPEDCTYARRISSKEQCVFWKPITPPAAPPAPAVPQGVHNKIKCIKVDLMHQRRFGADSLQGWRGACTSAEGDIEDVLKLIAATPSPAFAVPQGLQPIETIKYWADAYSDRASGPHFQGHGMVVQLLREYAQLREALAATPTTAPAQDPSEMTLRDYAEALIEAGHDFWKACRRDAGGGAVRWLSCDDGTLIVFTRCEYREAIVGAVGGYRATEVVFEDQGSDEQNGMVACAAPSQEPAVPQGWKLVPVEPVAAMTWAATVTADREWCYHVGRDDAKKLWAAMLAATPAAPSQPVTLTDEEIDRVAADGMRNASGGIYATSVYLFARAIIAALREKEGK